MKNRYLEILKKLLKVSSEIKGSGYSLRILATTRKNLNPLVVKSDKDIEHLLDLDEVIYIQAIFYLGEIGNELLYFSISSAKRTCLITRNKDLNFLYKNHLANTRSISKEEYHWWEIIEEFVCTVRRASVKEITLKEMRKKLVEEAVI